MIHSRLNNYFCKMIHKSHGMHHLHTLYHTSPHSRRSK